MIHDIAGDNGVTVSTQVASCIHCFNGNLNLPSHEHSSPHPITIDGIGAHRLACSTRVIARDIHISILDVSKVGGNRLVSLYLPRSTASNAPPVSDVQLFCV